MIRLYGNTKGNTSWPRVTKGIKAGLEAAGKLAGLCEPDFIDKLDDSFPVGFDASIGLYVGPPGKCGVMDTRGTHEHRLAIIAANSSWLPSVTMRSVAKVCTGLIGPSKWACSVLEKYSEGLPVYLYKHGVSPEFKPDSTYIDRLSERRFRCFEVLHLASTNMQRKGTRQLVLAWGQLIASGTIPEGSKLRILVAWPPGWVGDAIEEACTRWSDKRQLVQDSYVLSPPRNLTEADMCRLMQEHHVLCQPSRGEGFGMTICESRASAVPVCATGCTGHSEHMKGDGPGVVYVENGPDEPIDDGPGAMAPSVIAEDVAVALAESFERWSELARQAAEAAPRFAEKWSWPKVTQEFLEEFNE